jgi:hypothetical protein
MNEVSMLTDKQIANMRKNVNQRWVSRLMAILSIVMVALAIARLHMVDVLCQRTGITWSQIWTVALSGPDFNTIYVGAELKAQEMLLMSGINIILAIVMGGGALAASRQRKRDILLLEYIDKEIATKRVPDPFL